MQTPKKLLLAGAVLALAGGSGLALAQPLHRMTIQLPDGGLAQIQYAGSVPPRVTFAPQPWAADYHASASPFAMFEQVSAQMDREMDALMSDVAMGPPVNSPMFNVDMRNLPAGATQYSIVSTVAGNGNVCTRSVEITRAGPGAQPHVVKHTSGDCRGELTFSPAPLAHAAPPVEARAWRPYLPANPKPLNVAYRSTR
ncbi:MAG: hypothetical protein WCC36_09995 [Gammaproteobacteria bacterium]